jgi:plasmid stabilization system protein ParE
MKVEFLDVARMELDQAFEWYEAQQKDLGFQFINEFDAAIRRILAFPEAYQLLDNDMRRCLVKRFPYGIWYGLDTEKNTVVVVSVAHLHRKPDYWIDRIRSNL